MIYWHSTTETGQRELFVGLLEHLKYRVTHGTIADLRERVYRLLKSCQVEMIILDEAHRFRPKTFSEIRDIFDLLGISIVLVDRLDAVVRRDEQVHNRFMAYHRFHRFDSQTLEDTTAIWEEYVLKLPQPSNLTSTPMHDPSIALLNWIPSAISDLMVNPFSQFFLNRSGIARVHPLLLVMAVVLPPHALEQKTLWLLPCLASRSTSHRLNSYLHLCLDISNTTDLRLECTFRLQTRSCPSFPCVWLSVAWQRWEQSALPNPARFHK